MSDFKKQMSGLAHSSNAKGGLYAVLIGMALGNLMPSISDGIYFLAQAKLRDRWKRGEISATQYWKKNVIYYYTIPCTYWILVALVVINIKGNANQKMKITLALLGGGVVAGIIMKAIQSDKKQLIKEDDERDLLLRKHPEVVKILQQPEFENIAGQLIKPKDENSSGADGEIKYVKLFREREEEQRALNK